MGWMAETVAKAAHAAHLDPGLVDDWIADQRQRIREDRFLYVSMHFVTSARRP